MPLILDGTKGETFPSWTTAGRPTSPVAGQTGYNTTLGGLETYNGTAWVTPDFGPAFSAYNTGNQALSASTWTKITLPSEEFDTNNNFDSTTNYRFTPTIAGYYQFACCFNISAASGIVLVSLYKNGSEFKRLQQISMNSGANIQPNGGAIIYLNGSTDYVEMYGYQNSAGSVNTAGGQSQVYFQGALVRAG